MQPEPPPTEQRQSTAAPAQQYAPLSPTGKAISETRCTCTACGKVWHYGKLEVTENVGAAMSNVGKSMMCCGGCWPALFIPNKKVVALDKCPNCGSKAVLKEKVTHHV